MPVKIDSHHHFWDTSDPEYDYYWMSEELNVIKGLRGPNDLRPWIKAKGIDKTIIVQTIPSLRETEEFLETAAKTDFVAGVVGWIDLTDGDAAEVLSKMKTAANGKYLVGIRHQVHDEADAEWLLRKDVQRGIGAVGKADLAYDILVRPRELPAALAVVRAFPDMRFVVDHMAKPNIRKKEIEPWASRMRALAEYPNVWVKVSGMITEADWYAWKPDDLKPYVRKLLDWFGPKRLLFGSDWPVCTLAGTYAQVFDAAVHALGDLGADEMDAVFGGNAAKAYKIAV